MGAISPAHLIIVLVIAVLVIGPGKLPETGAALGRAMKDFRSALDSKDEVVPQAQTAGPAIPPNALGLPAAIEGAAAFESRENPQD